MDKNAHTIPKPEVLTVESLRKLLNDMENVWSKQDVRYLGEFEKQLFNCPHYNGIGPAKVDFSGGFGFVILPKDE